MLITMVAFVGRVYAPDRPQFEAKVHCALPQVNLYGGITCYKEIPVYRGVVCHESDGGGLGGGAASGAGAGV